MQIQLTAPSKTFLLGEYVALQGGPSLVLTSAPYFTLTCNLTTENTPVILEGVSSESPAGKLLLQQAEILKGYRLTFHDPHQQMGGFGASSAQFLLLSAFKKIIKKFSLKNSFTAHEILEEYWQFAWDKQGIKPSGADIIAQIQGGISYFYPANKQLKTLAWPFADLNYYLLRTHTKIATHQYLKTLNTLTIQELYDLIFKGLQHLQTQNAEGFIQCVQQYGQALQARELVLPNTIELLNKLTNCPYVLAAKGCGALGADVILILAAKNNHTDLLNWLTNQQFNVITCGQHTSIGLQITSKVNLTL